MADDIAGIVLEIPPSVLDNIGKADKAIKELAKTSADTAQSVNNDWGTTAVMGLDAFIKKVEEAKEKTKDINVNINVNDRGLSSLAQSLTQNAGSISEIAQKLAQLAPNATASSLALSKVSDAIKAAFPYEARKNIDQLSTAIKNINDKLKDTKGGVPKREDEQYLVNLRDIYQQELNLLNQSDRVKQDLAQKAEARASREFERQQELARKRNEQYNQELANERLLDAARQKRVDTAGQKFDNDILREQNRLLNERLKIQKQIGNLAVVETKNTILGKQPLSADQLGLRADLTARISEIDKRLSELGTKYDLLGAKAQQAFDTRNFQSYLNWQQETIRNEENIAKARVKAKAMLAAQSVTSLQPTAEELPVQRQLITLYNQKLNIEKEIQQVNNQITLSGRAANAAQQQYLTYLTNQARNLDGEIGRIGSGYARIEQSVKNQYLADWMRAQEKAAYDLAQAQEQVNKARQKEDVQKKLAEYKALVAENEKLASAMKAYVQSAGRTPQPSDTSASATAYRDMERQWQDNEARRRQISAKNITEIVEYERQMRMKENQQSVADFIQAQKQMAAAARQTAKEQSEARQQAYQKYINTYEGAIRYADKLQTGRSTGNYADTYENRERAIKQLETALKSVSRADANYDDKVRQLTTRLKALGIEQDKINELLKRQPKQLTIADAQNLAATARATKSLQDYERAYKALKDVMSRTQFGSADWNRMNAEAQKFKKEIDEIRKKMGEFSSQSQRMSGIAGQLKNMLVGVFSVSAIKSYITELVKVRAQFELQNVALRAILQNKDEADRIFAQVQQMALQSPFSIMQLTTYTKQLAAYRIEADKLVGTTKMLADVSAGLGVDIQRLILAYGQVKSANYLRACLGRGTEIKTMRGIVKVEDIVIGDKLYNDHNEVTTVAELYSGTQQMYKFTELAPDGYSYRVNEAHILTMYDKQTNAVVDVKVIDYLQYPERYMGVRMSEGEICTYAVKCQKDIVDEYFGFKLDGNKRFQLVDGTITHNTEVRQFTEAGLNIAGELAQYFSELQGKMISVGDVMEMITKRMVRFEDVEEVFKRVTSAGGLFYDMQKKQSETLSGQMQRIGDAISIMFNEIGKSNQGFISDVLSTLRALISNWRTIASIMKLVVGIGGGLLLVIKSINIQAKSNAILKWITSIWTSFQQAIVAAGGFKAALMSLNVTGWGAIISGIGLAIAAIHSFITSASALREELDRVLGESMTDMYNAMFQFKALAETATDATKPFKERTEAMEELHRTFKDILPAEKLEIENLRQMTDGYQEATTAIKEYYNEAAKKKAQETIANETEQAWTKLINRVKDTAEMLQYEMPELAHLPVGTIKGLLGKTMLELKSEIEDGTTDVNEAWVRFKELFEETSGIKFEEHFYARSIKAYFGEVTGTTTDFYDDIKDIVEDANEAQQEFDAQFREGFSKETQAIIEEYNKREKAVKDFNTKMMAYAQAQQKGLLTDDKGELTEEGRDVTQELNAAKAAMNQYLGSLGEAQIRWKDLTTATQNNTDALLFFNGVQQRVLGGFIQFTKKTSEDTSVQAWAQKAERDLRASGLSDLQLDIISLAKQSAEASGVQMSWLDKLRVSAETNYTSAAEDAHKLSLAAADNIAKITATKIQLMQLGMTAEQAQRQAESMHGNGLTEEQLKQQQEFFDTLAKLYGYSEKKKSGGKGKDPWQDRVSLIKEMNTEYEKLLKYYNESEAKLRVQKSYAEAVSEAFKGIKLNGKNLGDIKVWEGFDKQGMIDQLRAILDSGLKISKEKRAELQKMLAGFKATIDIEIQEDRLEKLKQEFNDVFANYDLTKELGNLGLNVDLTYLVGGKPMTLAQARKELQDTYNKALADGQLGEDAEKAYKDALKKLADLEHKAQIDRLKNYNKYLIESVGERAQIELKAAQDITKIRNDETLDDFSKEQAILQRRKKMYEELTKFDFDQFKGGDVYLSVFKDLEAASKEQLTYVISKLKEMQSTFKDLSPVQVKSIASEIKKLEEALAGKDSVKNLFTNLKESIKYARQRKDLLKEQTTIQQKLDANQKAESDAEKYLVELTQQRDAIQDRLSDEWEEANKKVLEQQAFVKKLKDRIKELEDELGIVTDKIDKGTLSWESFSAGAKNISQYVGAVKQAVDDIFEGLNSAFNLNDSTRDAFESVSEILGGLGKTMEGLAEIDFTKPLSVITGIGKAIGGIFSTIGGFFGIGDKKKERQIQRLTDKVNDLSKAYDKLQDSMEEAYTFDDYNASYQRMQKTLEAEKMAYREMIALEQAKKKSDKDKIKEYEDALDELAEKEAEIRKERIEAMGSTTDYLNEAENFVSAWLDAYKETGDGLDALGDKWNDFIENLFVKQAAAQIVSAKLKPIIDTINKAIEENKTDFDLSEAIDDARQEWEEAIKEIQPILEKLFGSYGLTKDTGELVLSDLQKGIQNITEPQAAAIEAYLNSMRFEMFHHTEQLDKLITAIQTQYGGGDSPILVEVRAIRSILTNIDDRFRSITESATGRGLVLKVN